MSLLRLLFWKVSFFLSSVNARIPVRAAFLWCFFHDNRAEILLTIEDKIFSATGLAPLPRSQEDAVNVVSKMGFICAGIQFPCYKVLDMFFYCSSASAKGITDT